MGFLGKLCKDGTVEKNYFPKSHALRDRFGILKIAYDNNHLRENNNRDSKDDILR